MCLMNSKVEDRKGYTQKVLEYGKIVGGFKLCWSKIPLRPLALSVCTVGRFAVANFNLSLSVCIVHYIQKVFWLIGEMAAS